MLTNIREIADTYQQMSIILDSLSQDSPAVPAYLHSTDVNRFAPSLSPSSKRRRRDCSEALGGPSYEFTIGFFDFPVLTPAFPHRPSRELMHEKLSQVVLNHVD